MYRYAILFLITVTLRCPIVADDSFLIAGDAKAAIAVLESDASIYEKAKACQRLAIFGDASSVESLLGLVDHPQLSTYALTALGQIPGPESDSAMINAIDRLKGRPLIGLLHAIGQRELKPATLAIRARMMSGALDNEEMQAAIQSLGNIGTMAAWKSLREAELSSADGLTRRLHADALQKCKMQGSERANEMTRQQLNLIFENMADGDDNFQHALMTARKIGSRASTTLANKLPTLSPSRQALTLICLADLGGSHSIAASRALIESNDDEVAVRAVEAVAKLGGFNNERELPAFVRSKPELASRLMPALASVANESIDQDVIRSIAKIAAGKQSVPTEMQVAYIEYASMRRLSSATPLLLTLSTSDHPSVRTAALAAAGLTVNTDQFASLIDRVTDQRDDPSVAAEALQRACVHLPQDDAAETIAAAIKNADNETRSLLLSQLAFLGGTKALQIVTGLAASGDEGAIDAATQVLGEWTTADVAAPLLRLTDQLPKGKYQLRALRGYLRVGRQLDMPVEARLELCKNGLARAVRDDERILVLEILRRFPSKAGFVWLAELVRGDVLDSQQVTNRAFTTLAHVAGRIANDDAATVSRELTEIDLSKAPAAARPTLEALR